MFSADFISGSRDFTQHLTSGELILTTIYCLLAICLHTNFPTERLYFEKEDRNN